MTVALRRIMTVALGRMQADRDCCTGENARKVLFSVEAPSKNKTPFTF